MGKKDFSKIMHKLGIILRFNAQLISDKPEDSNRRFVVQYFIEDDTICIREPPVPNSGILGGSFLKRQKCKKQDSTEYNVNDFYVGAILYFVGQRFILLNADEFTYKYMEQNYDEKTFPYNNFFKLQKSMKQYKDEIKLYFISNYDGNGTYIFIKDFEKCCNNVGLNFNQHEIITLWRNLDIKRKGRIKFMKVVKLASEDIPF